MSDTTKIQAHIGREHYMSQLNIRGHQLTTDEPLEDGGKDAGPTPIELVLSGLAACTVSTLRMYADKKGWEVEQIDVEMHIRIDKTTDGQTSYISTVLDITGNITDEQKQRMVEIAGKCPVHRMLTHPIEIDTKLKT